MHTRKIVEIDCTIQIQYQYKYYSTVLGCYCILLEYLYQVLVLQYIVMEYLHSGDFGTTKQIHTVRFPVTVTSYNSHHPLHNERL